MRLLRPLPSRALPSGAPSPRAPSPRITARLAPAALLLPALLLSAPLAAQQVYKWKDAAGVTHYTAEPPPQGSQYEAREVDHHEAVPQPVDADAGDDAPAAPAGEDPACATARGNLALLSGNAQVMMDSNGDGKPDKPLSDADRARQRNLAEAVIAAKCGGGDASQAAEPAPEPEER